MKTVRDACQLQPNALTIKLSDQIKERRAALWRDHAASLSRRNDCMDKQNPSTDRKAKSPHAIKRYRSAAHRTERLPIAHLPKAVDPDRMTAEAARLLGIGGTVSGWPGWSQSSRFADMPEPMVWKRFLAIGIPNCQRYCTLRVELRACALCQKGPCLNTERPG